MIRRHDDDPMSIEDSEKWNEEIARREAQESTAKGLPPDRKRKRRELKFINFIPVHLDTWQALVTASNNQGIKLWEFVGATLDLLVDSGKLEKILNSSEFQVDLLQLKARRYYDRIEWLEISIAKYNEHPTDEMAHMLMQQCDMMGIDFNDLVKQVKSDPLIEAATEFRLDPDTKTNQCTRWMRNFMKKHDYRVSARDGNSIGLTAGFSKDMLATIRRTLGIRSIRDDDGEYYWVAPKSDRVARAILGGEDNDQE